MSSKSEKKSNLKVVEAKIAKQFTFSYHAQNILHIYLLFLEFHQFYNENQTMSLIKFAKLNSLRSVEFQYSWLFWVDLKLIMTLYCTNKNAISYFYQLLIKLVICSITLFFAIVVQKRGKQGDSVLWINARSDCNKCPFEKTGFYKYKSIDIVLYFLNFHWLLFTLSTFSWIWISCVEREIIFMTTYFSNCRQKKKTVKIKPFFRCYS